MRKYDFLFFDLDNTLWDFSTNARAALLLTLEELNFINELSSFDEYFQVYEEINDSLWVDYRNKKVSKQVLIAERFSRSLSAFNITNKNWNDINSLYLENMGKQTSLIPGTLETLQYLKGQGYKMHIITNGFKEVQYSKIHNTGLSAFIDKVFVSEEIHTTKPHREIFEHALKSSNALKKKSIMIGDSWEIDIEGAKSFGMDQVMVLNNGHNKVPDSIITNLLKSDSAVLELKQNIKTYFIKEITELVSIL